MTTLKAIERLIIILILCGLGLMFWFGLPVAQLVP